MHPKNKSVIERRNKLLAEIRQQISIIIEHGSENPLVAVSSASALSALLDTYLELLPRTYRGDAPNDRAE
jgi:hypothetical protein